MTRTFSSPLPLSDEVASKIYQTFVSMGRQVEIKMYLAPIPPDLANENLSNAQLKQLAKEERENRASWRWIDYVIFTI